MKLFWSLPTPARGRHAHPITPDAVQRAADAAERLGFDGLVLPEGRAGADPWLLAAGLARDTERMSLVVGLRPGATTPALAARMAATLDRLTDGRQIVEVQNGGEVPRDLARMRLSVIVRENALSAWRAADDVPRGFDGHTAQRVHAAFTAPARRE